MFVRICIQLLLKDNWILTLTEVAWAFRSPPAAKVPCLGTISKNLLASIFDFVSGTNSNLIIKLDQNMKLIKQKL